MDGWMDGWTDGRSLLFDSLLAGWAASGALEWMGAACAHLCYPALSCRARRTGRHAADGLGRQAGRGRGRVWKGHACKPAFTWLGLALHTNASGGWAQRTEEEGKGWDGMGRKEDRQPGHR